MKNDTVVVDHVSRSTQHFLSIFQTVLLCHNTIQYNTIHYNTKTGEKNFNTKVDLLLSQFIT
jgi:hypothetical protein